MALKSTLFVLTDTHARNAFPVLGIDEIEVVEKLSGVTGSYDRIIIPYAQNPEGTQHSVEWWNSLYDSSMKLQAKDVIILSIIPPRKIRVELEKSLPLEKKQKLAMSVLPAIPIYNAIAIGDIEMIKKSLCYG